MGLSKHTSPSNRCFSNFWRAWTRGQGERIYFKPIRGVKEGCPCSPLLFAIVCDLPIKRLVAKFPDTFVYIDDITIIVIDYSELE